MAVTYHFKKFKSDLSFKMMYDLYKGFICGALIFLNLEGWLNIKYRYPQTLVQWFTMKSTKFKCPRESIFFSKTTKCLAYEIK